jgi:hypothetical protein
MTCNEALEIIESGDGLEIINQTVNTIVESGPVSLEVNSDCVGLIELPVEVLELEVLNEITELEVQNEVVELEIIEQLIINNPDIDPPTEDTDAVVCSFEADSQINVNRAVVLLPNGRIEHADKDTTADACDIIGVSRQSGAAGQFVDVVKFGKLTGAALGGIGNNYFLGNNGLLVTTPPATGIWLQLGVQMENTVLFVKLSEPIIRG